MEKKVFISFIVIVIVLAVIFYPKPYVKGGLSGFVGPEQTAYKEEYSCFGFKHSYYPKDCMDCSTIYNCYGIPYGKICYMEKFSIETGAISKELTNCK